MIEIVNRNDLVDVPSFEESTLIVIQFNVQKPQANVAFKYFD